MVFIPDSVPDKSLDTDGDYVADVPFDLKQTQLSSRRHRWFQTIVIGTATGPYTTTRGLQPGMLMRVQFDQKPDFIIVAISGETANTGRANVFSGDEGGPYFPLGPGGKVSMPGPQGGIVTLRNVGTTPTYGVIVAVAGYTDPGIDVTLGG